MAAVRDRRAAVGVDGVGPDWRTGFGRLSPIGRIQVGAMAFGGTTYCLSRLFRGHPWRWSLSAITAPLLLYAILFAGSIWAENQ